MNESVEAIGRDNFILKQRLLEAQMARDEADRHKERLRDTAARLLADVRAERERVAVLEGHVRRLERENEALRERLPGEAARFDDLRDALVRAQADLVAAHESCDESELLVDALQLQLAELRTQLARARGYGTGDGDA